jgi:2-keto-4-pentenoate hydratase/2-oxohepta-3-ene-1,7-dioic acid hydratase in catechol pathway
MRLVRYRHGPATGVGVRVGEFIVPTGFGDMLDLIRGGQAAIEVVRQTVEAAAPRGSAASGPSSAEVRLLAPIARPGKIFGSGINYASHKEENPMAVMPVEPGYFAKLPSAVIGPGDAIVLPYPEAQVDYEVELAVVIGRTARRVSRAEALDYVFGYTVIDDVSARDVQFKNPRDQWITHGKGFDTFCPMGPEIVLPDEIPDPATLRVRSFVNGEPRQNAPTSEMLFPVPGMVEFLSRYVTLEPGDVISTGTPAGCGTFRQPPLWLRPGDTVDVEVDQIGRLTNPVVAGW